MCVCAGVCGCVCVRLYVPARCASGRARSVNCNTHTADDGSPDTNDGTESKSYHGQLLQVRVLHFADQAQQLAWRGKEGEGRTHGQTPALPRLAADGCLRGSGCMHVQVGLHTSSRFLSVLSWRLSSPCATGRDLRVALFQRVR